ncbi:IS3 family transposase [Mesoplasma tabanidae]|uniref:IS3 family transposase n=1 Tax=Mesoplasma tabanidae TaxID=219745 RepID=UPI000C294E36|nr:IS3 family transposase [Mesoplasma tabanidae]
MIISLSNPGLSLDNAACETFFSQLKTEEPEVLKQKDFNRIKEIIQNYINYYNFIRIRIKSKNPPAYNYLKQAKSHFTNEMTYY